MKKPTAKVFLRFNKNNKASITIRYTYNRERHPFPLGVTISIEDWDSKRERVNFNVLGSALINSKIKETVLILEKLSNELIETGEAPTVSRMKEVYTSYMKDTAIKEFYKARSLRYDTEVLSRSYDRTLSSALEKVREISRLEKALEKQSQKLDYLNNLVLDRGVEVDKISDKHPAYYFQEFLKTAEVAKKLSHLSNQEDTIDESNRASKTKFKDLLNEYIEEKTGVVVNASKEELKTTPRAKSGTNRGLRSWAKTLLEFIECKQVKHTRLRIGIHNFSPKFYDTYASFLQSPKPEGKDMYNNTFGAHIKKLKGFCNWLEEDKQLNIDKRHNKFKILYEEKEVIHLFKEDIDLLYKFTPENKSDKSEATSWRKYIDFTVFSFFTSLRVSDVKRIQSFRIIDGFLFGDTKKTKNEFKIPLRIDKRILEILERYDYNLKFFSEVEYNRTIKKLLKIFCEKYNLYQRPIAITRYKYIESEPIVTIHNFYDLYTSHCNRRGFVNHLLSLGFVDSEIMDMMGTKSHKEFQKYKKKQTLHIVRRLDELLPVSTN